jgi:hypothetical protein
MENGREVISLFFAPIDSLFIAVQNYRLAMLVEVDIFETMQSSVIPTGNAACTESSTLCREPDPKLSAQGRFAESKRSSSWHRKTRGTDGLCREGAEQTLGTAIDSRHRGTMARVAEAGPRHS